MEIIQQLSLENESILYIFLLFLLSDLVNLLIIAALLKKYVYKPRWILVGSFLILTISRTFYFILEPTLYEWPGARLFSGIVLLVIAVYLMKKINSLNQSDLTLKSTFLILLVVFVTDFSICFENIVITAHLSNNFLEVVIGIFVGLICAFSFLRFFYKLLNTIPFFTIIVAGFLVEAAFMGIYRDPLFQSGLNLLGHISETIPTFINDNFTLLSFDIAILTIIFGSVKQMKK